MKFVKSSSQANMVAPQSVETWSDICRTYVINLERRPERLKFITEQFSKFGMSFERFAAVDGKNISVPDLAAAGVIAPPALIRYWLPADVKLFGIDLTDGGIGCALSHMYIWRDF